MPDDEPQADEYDPVADLEAGPSEDLPESEPLPDLPESESPVVADFRPPEEPPRQEQADPGLPDIEDQPKLDTSNLRGLEKEFGLREGSLEEVPPEPPAPSPPPEPPLPSQEPTVDWNPPEGRAPGMSLEDRYAAWEDAGSPEGQRPGRAARGYEAGTYAQPETYTQVEDTGGGDFYAGPMGGSERAVAGEAAAPGETAEKGGEGGLAEILAVLNEIKEKLGEKEDKKKEGGLEQLVEVGNSISEQLGEIKDSLSEGLTWS